MTNNQPIPLLMTRPLEAAKAFVGSLAPEVMARITPVYAPLIQIVPTKISVRIQEDETVIFTSSNGVAHGPDGGGRPAVCVGDVTTCNAIAHGWAAQKLGENAQDLYSAILQNRPKEKFVHLSGVHTRGDIAASLSQAGRPTRHYTVYDQRLCDLNDAARNLLSGERDVLIPLFSPRTAEHLFRWSDHFDHAHFLAMSDAVAECVPKPLQARVTICKSPTAASMAKEVRQSVIDLGRS